jgi:hypothetical protein
MFRVTRSVSPEEKATAAIETVYIKHSISWRWRLKLKVSVFFSTPASYMGGVGFRIGMDTSCRNWGFRTMEVFVILLDHFRQNPLVISFHIISSWISSKHSLIRLFLYWSIKSVDCISIRNSDFPSLLTRTLYHCWSSLNFMSDIALCV